MDPISLSCLGQPKTNKPPEFQRWPRLISGIGGRGRWIWIEGLNLQKKLSRKIQRQTSPPLHHTIGSPPFYFNSSTVKEEAGGICEFQVNEGYIVRSCHINKPNNRQKTQVWQLTCNPRTGKAEVGRLLRDQGQPGLQSELKKGMWRESTLWFWAWYLLSVPKDGDG